MNLARSPVIPYAHRAAMIIAAIQARQQKLGPESGAVTASFVANAMYAAEGWAIPTTQRVVRQMKKEGLLREINPTPAERMQNARPMVVTAAGRTHAKRYLKTPPPTPPAAPSDGTATTR